MNILFTLLNYNSLTGSEMYVYELSKELAKRGHTVGIQSHVDTKSEIVKKSQESGVWVFDFDQLVTFTPDIIHAQQTEPTKRALEVYPTVPLVCTIHSERLPLYEAPVLDPRIKKYICIRYQIQDMLIIQYGIYKKDTALIFNGFDTTRFKPYDMPDTPRILFVGSLDYLRRNVVLDLISKAENEGIFVDFVGRGFDKLAQKHKTPNCTFNAPTWHTEKYLQRATCTAGILVGRTTIEGWLCGRSGWVYDVDSEGNITKKQLMTPPDDLKPFDITFMTNRIEKIYKEIV